MNVVDFLFVDRPGFASTCIKLPDVGLCRERPRGGNGIGRMRASASVKAMRARSSLACGLCARNRSITWDSDQFVAVS